MRYILVDPEARTVTEGDADLPADVGEDTRPFREAIYGLLRCHTFESHDLGVKPLHEVLMDENAGFLKPPPPTFGFGEVLLLGRVLVLGVSRTRFKPCTLALEKVAAAVQWGTPPRVNRPMEIKRFASGAEMEAHLRERAKGRPRFLPPGRAS